MVVIAPPAVGEAVYQATISPAGRESQRADWRRAVVSLLSRCWQQVIWAGQAGASKARQAWW
jgi:hypothetical protein